MFLYLLLWHKNMKKTTKWTKKNLLRHTLTHVLVMAQVFFFFLPAMHFHNMKWHVYVCMFDNKCGATSVSELNMAVTSEIYNF